MKTDHSPPDPTKHTPGTWEAKEQWGYIKVHSTDNGVCVIHALDSKAQANARLIAASPELLCSLQALLDWGRDHISPTHAPEAHALLMDAHAAIAKATNLQEG